MLVILPHYTEEFYRNNFVFIPGGVDRLWIVGAVHVRRILADPVLILVTQGVVR